MFYWVYLIFVTKVESKGLYLENVFYWAAQALLSHTHVHREREKNRLNISENEVAENFWQLLGRPTP